MYKYGERVIRKVKIVAALTCPDFKLDELKERSIKR